jgi:SAM-dependent methyltransferase
MFEFLFSFVLLLLAPFLMDYPILFAAWTFLMLPGLYAMITGAPFVPSSQKIMEKMMELANIQPGERVYDLGCGDGRVVRAAAKQGARSIGFELSPFVYIIAKLRSLFLPNTSIRFRDFWGQNLADADVVFCYLLTASMQTFKKELWPTLKPGTRVVSHAFAMEGIEPSKQIGDVRLYVK